MLYIYIYNIFEISFFFNNYPSIYKLWDHNKNSTATLQCKDMNFKYTARARKIVCYRLVTFSDVYAFK